MKEAVEDYVPEWVPSEIGLQRWYTKRFRLVSESEKICVLPRVDLKGTLAN